MAGLFDSQIGLFDDRVGTFEDGGVDALSAVPTVTASPTVGQPNLVLLFVLDGNSVVTSSPSVASLSLVQDHSLSTSDVTLGNTSVSSSSLTQDHDLQADAVTLPEPEVPSLDFTEGENSLATPILTGSVDVGDATLVQGHVLTATTVRTGSPDVGTADDPNAIIIQEIEEIQQMFGGWPRRAYEVPDGKLVQAEREIESTYGDRVSIDRKAKSVIKFGKSADLNANDLETVWTVGGNETYVTDNLIDRISSSSASDNQTIRLECHSVEGTGTDAKFTFLVQEVTLNGQTPVPLDTPVARVSHATNSNGTELVGRVTVYEDTIVSNGVPSDESKIHIDIEEGMQGSLKAATTFSDGDYYILTGGFGSVSKKQDASADFYLEVRQAGGVFIQSAAVSASKGGPWDITLDPAVIIPKNADIRVRVDSDTNNAVVFTVFKGYLAKVIS